MKTICIIATEDEAKALAPHIKKLNAKVIAYTPEAANALRKAGIVSLPIDKYTNKIDFIKLDKVAYSWAKTWYNKVPKISHNGISLGELSDTDLFSNYGRKKTIQTTPYLGTFDEIIIGIERILATFDKEQPDLVLVTPTWLGTLLKNTCNAKKIKVINIQCKPNFKNNFQELITHTKDTLKYHFSKVAKKIVKIAAKKPEKSKGKINILLNNNYPPTFSPIYLDLKQNPKNNPIMLVKGLSAIKRALNQHIAFITLDDFRTNEIDKIVKQKIQMLRIELNTLIKNPPNFQYRGVQFFDLIKNNLEFLYLVRYPEGILQLELIKNMLKTEKIDVAVLLSDAAPSDRAIAMTAKQMQVKTLHIQHGVFNGPVTKLYCTQMATFGPSGIRAMELIGHNKKRLIAVGQAKFDSILSEKHNKEKICNAFGFDSKKPIILFTSQPTACGSEDPWYYYKMIQMVFESCKDRQLIIKAHPSEPLEQIKQIAKECEVNPIIVRSANLQELISACDVLLILNSTSGLEAMIMKKPMIVVNPGKHLYFDYAKGGGALVAHNSKELSEKISSILNNPITTVRLLKNAEKFLKDNLTNSKGGATKATVKLIESLGTQTKNWAKYS